MGVENWAAGLKSHFEPVPTLASHPGLGMGNNYKHVVLT